MGHNRPVRKCLAGVLLAAVALSGAAAGCGSASPAVSKPPAPAERGTGSTHPGTSSPPTTAPATSTTAYRPSTTRSSPDGAATYLIDAWAAGNRAEAAQIAAPGAVATLFAVAYPGSQLQGRGCSAQFSPADCDYRDGDALIKVYASQSPAGWYVSSVTVED